VRVKWSRAIRMDNGPHERSGECQDQERQESLFQENLVSPEIVLQVGPGTVV